MIFNKVGFVGFGLIGGSIAKSIKKYALVNHIVAFDQNLHALELAKDEKVIDQIASSLEKDFTDCDLIFLCCPVQINIKMAKTLSKYIKPTCVLTDVGSTKGDIHSALEAAGIRSRFVGGHPMTGSEKSGYQSSDARLFENVYYILTPSSTSVDSDVALLKTLIEGIDSIPLIMSSSDHDVAAASISHVPHIMAAIIVNAVETMDESNGYMHTLAAGGFKDITRIASASPIMWQQICLTNKEAILNALNHMSDLLADAVDMVKAEDGGKLETLFSKAKDYRATFNDSKHGLLPSDYGFSIDVDDEPGIIARVSTLLYEQGINIKNIGIVNNREIDKGVLKVQFNEQQHMTQSISLLDQLGFTIYR